MPSIIPEGTIKVLLYFGPNTLSGEADFPLEPPVTGEVLKEALFEALQQIVTDGALQRILLDAESSTTSS